MNTPAAVTADAVPANGKRRRILLILALIFVAGFIAWLLLWYFVLSRRETTDDAYVGGNMVSISSQIPGTVSAVLVDDTQRVVAGQPLIRLDPTDSQVTLDQAGAALAEAVRQVRQQTATAHQFDATVRSRRLELQLAEADLARRTPLLVDQAIAPEEVRHAQNTVAVDRAALEAAERQAAAAHVPVADVHVEDNPTVRQAIAAYVQAWIAVRRTTIPSPVTGYVAQRSVQLGQRIQPGQALMTVVPLNDLWIDANFKEVQLRHLRIGQPADISTDIYGGDAVFHGRVEGMAAGTGSAFALLPAQNASGNWIKVVQRVPVRIWLDPRELQQHPLRIGLSTDVKVTTTDLSGPMLARAPSRTPVAVTDIYAGDITQASAQAVAIIRAAQASVR